MNATLAIVKLFAGVLGHAYALVADAVESTADILSSTIVMGGLRVAAREPDDQYPFGYGKAESLAAATVSLMLVGAAIGIALKASSEIRTPHHAPAAWSLGVLVAVMLIKWSLSRRVRSVGVEIGSAAVQADAWHHMSDAVTSAAAFVGISIALLGGRGWEAADDWAALAAAAIVAYNGVRMLRPALRDLMDRTPEGDVLDRLGSAAAGVPGVLGMEKLYVRRSGTTLRLTIHVFADPQMTLEAAHALSGAVKAAMRAADPRVGSVLVHMEPARERTGDGARPLAS